MTDFTLSATVASPYDDTVERVRGLLADLGFGVQTELRIILGACRPPLALQALAADPRAATMLPCNVVVAAAGHETTVEVFDPAVMTEFSPALAEVASESRERLSGMMNALTRELEDPDAARA